ncbi:MAG: hypothetical protein M3389_01410, partial [Actinomycetota bacterium]|nr:hypothetical protein [Actinomycetota bacterium]
MTVIRTTTAPLRRSVARSERCWSAERRKRRALGCDACASEPSVRRPIAAAAKRARAAVVLRMPPSIVHRLVAAGRAPVLYDWVAGLGLSPSARIVDVGSGSGSLLADFA